MAKTQRVPPSEAVIDGEVVKGPGYVPNVPVQEVQARVVPKASAPGQPRLNVRLGDAVALSLPVSPMTGLVALGAAAVLWKVVLPRVLGPPPRRRRRIKMLPTGGK